MTRSAAKSFPVPVTQLPVTRCEICQRTVAYRPGEASEALTKHHKLLHKDALGEKPREAKKDFFPPALPPPRGEPCWPPRRGGCQVASSRCFGARCLTARCL